MNKPSAPKNSSAESPKHQLVSFGYREVPEEEKAHDVEEVFDSVARRYDLMNDLLSFGMHRLWKHKAIEATGLLPGSKVLDIATGTCDLALAFEKKVGPQGTVWATDINHEMLKQGMKRLQLRNSHIHVAQCDCEALSFPDNTFDAAVVSFGLRNMTHKLKALQEMRRVVKSGGRVVVLEFSHCHKLLKPFYDFYSFHVMPVFGSWIAGDGPSYRYLAESIRMHPNQKALAEIMRNAGLSDVRWLNMTFGVCALHVGIKA